MWHMNQPQAPAADKLLFSVRETAAALSLTEWSIYRLLDSGELRGVYQGRRRYVTRDELDRYIASLADAPNEAVS